MSGFDLSAKTAAIKKREELRRLSSRTKSIKERMTMYNSDGGLRSSFVQDCELDDDDLDDFESLENFKDQASIDVARQNELEDIANDASLTEKERSEKLEGCRAKYGLAEMKLKIARVSFHKGGSSFHNKPPEKSKSFHKGSSFHEGPAERSSSVSFHEPPKEKSKSFHVPMPSKKDMVPRAERELKPNKGKRSSIDLSAKSAVVKKAQELAVLKSGGSSMSIKERMEMYKKSTSFHDKRDDGEKKFLEDKVEKTVDDLRREELLQVMKDKSLSREEKSTKMEEVKQKYAAMAGGGEPEQEQEAKPTTTTKEVDDLEKQRRSELQSIMRDKSLSREERKQKMDIVRWKYSNTNKDGHDTSSTESIDSSRITVDLSAKSYADRRRASLESLEQSIASSFYSHGEGGEDVDGEQHHVMSIRERLLMYRNNDEITNDEGVVGC